MSTAATLWAWDQRDVPARAKIVLLSLAERASEEHVAWPSPGRLALDTNLSESTIFRALSDLRKAGKIKPVGATARGTKKYQLIGVPRREGDEPAYPPPKPAKKAPAVAPAPPPAPIEINDDTKQAARAEFRGHDIDHLVVLWTEWVSGRIAKFGDAERPRHPQKAFLGWARKYAARNPATGNQWARADGETITIPESYVEAAKRCLALLDQVGQADLAGAFYALPGQSYGVLDVVANDAETIEAIKKSNDLVDALLAEFGKKRMVFWTVPTMVAAVYSKLKETEK